MKSDAKLANLLDETRSQLRSQAQEQTDRISATLSDLANQLRGMADNAPDPSSSVANLVGDGGARRLEDFATHLQAVASTAWWTT